MRTLAKSTLRIYWEQNAAAEIPLQRWFKATEAAEWTSFADVRRDFPQADQVGDRLVFNIGGNNYRLIVVVRYRDQALYIRWVGTHAEYDRLTREEIRTL